MRLFVGLYPPQAVLQDLPRRSGREHLTLAFLGEVDDPARLLVALGAVERHPAPLLRLAGAGRFRGGAVWLGLRGELDRLHRLHDAVQDAVEASGLPRAVEQWRPHLTIGRARAVPAALQSYEGPEAAWRDVALVHSTLTRQGAVHVPLRTWRLPLASGAAAPNEQPPG